MYYIAPNYGLIFYMLNNFIIGNLQIVCKMRIYVNTNIKIFSSSKLPHLKKHLIYLLFRVLIKRVFIKIDSTWSCYQYEL